MNGFDDLQRLADEVTGEAQDESGRFRSFLAALQAVLRLPADAHVIGEPVELLGLDYSGHSRQGLMARCGRRAPDPAPPPSREGPGGRSARERAS